MALHTMRYLTSRKRHILPNQPRKCDSVQCDVSCLWTADHVISHCNVCCVVRLGRGGEGSRQ